MLFVALAAAFAQQRLLRRHAGRDFAAQCIHARFAQFQRPSQRRRSGLVTRARLQRLVERREALAHQPLQSRGAALLLRIVGGELLETIQVATDLPGGRLIRYQETRLPVENVAALAGLGALGVDQHLPQRPDHLVGVGHQALRRILIGRELHGDVGDCRQNQK